MKFFKDKKLIVLSEAEYRESCDNYSGFCLYCGEENFSVEPDAEKYDCEVCGQREVYGTEQLLVLGKLDLE